MRSRRRGGRIVDDLDAAAGPGRTYSVILRIYSGSRPTRAASRRGPPCSAPDGDLPTPRPPPDPRRRDRAPTRISAKAELKPGMPVRCTLEGHSVTLPTPVYPATGSGTLASPRGNAPHISTSAGLDGSYTASSRCRRRLAIPVRSSPARTSSMHVWHDACSESPERAPGWNGLFAAPRSGAP